MKLNINIPESLNDIKLIQWQNFAKIEEPNDYDVLRCFYGIDTKGVFEMKQTDVTRLVNNIATILQSEPKDLIHSFKLGGKEFGFMPRLDDMSYGENLDLSTYVNDIDKAHLAMAVMFRPITNKQFGKYDIEEYKGSAEYGELMRSAPLGVYLSAKVFFYNLMNDLLAYIPTYLREQSRHLSVENGDNIQALLGSLEKNLTELMRYQKKTFISV